MCLAADMLGRFLCRLNADRSAGADTKSPKHMLRKGTYFACGADHEIPGRVPAAAEDKTGSALVLRARCLAWFPWFGGESVGDRLARPARKFDPVWKSALKDVPGADCSLDSKVINQL